ncbi:putative F-box protein At3g21120 [Neltuma alba]|uniref:putative F-box protein At3g21120 n=1 Tax=Neltuma alba TaxID=207710 RepID=UPI0010A2DC20|nr:putative F-box protein At3g21120 [Prosopis alba]
MEVHKLHKIPLENSRLTVRNLYSNHGLLCLEIVNKCHSLFLYNPATREVKQVSRRLERFTGTVFDVGFGFNPILNDHNIVRLFVSGYDEMVNKVEVNSLNMGSWKEVEVGNLRVVKLKHGESFSANGAIFWFGYTVKHKVYNGKKCEIAGRVWIVSFDVAKEASTLIPMPAEIRYKDGVSSAVYEYKLAILYPTAIENSETSSIDLWVMEEGTGPSGEKWTWTKKYTTSPFPRRYPWKLCPQTIGGIK